MKGFTKNLFDKTAIFFRKLFRSRDKNKQPALAAELTDLDKKLVFSLAKKRLPNWQQLQYLPKYLSPKEKLIMRGLIFIIIISLGFLIVRFYQRHVIYLPKEGGTYSEALVGQPSFVNPILAQNDVDLDISNLVYSGLFKYNQKLKLVPDLAENYQISDDKKTYTVKLRKNVTWHNGNKLMADDIIFTFKTIQDEDYNSPYFSNFSGVEINRIDDYTVSFTLPKPFAPFLSNLVIGILPAHIWNDVSPSNFKLAEYNTKPIGTGPFKFKELIKDRSGNIKSYTLEKNKNYYSQPAYLDKIILKFYPDFQTAISSLQNNKIDGISYIPKDLKEKISSNKKINIYHLQLPQYTAVFFNQKKSLFKNENINKALLIAADRKKILNEALDGDGKIINSPILEGFLGYDPNIESFSYDPARAAEVLDEQGWKVPEEGGLRKKNGAELKFSLTTVDQPEYIKTANILKENWEAVNIGVELKIMNPLRVDKEVIKPRNYEAFLYGEILGADPDPYPFWHSSQSFNGGLNLSNYYNKKADQLLEEAREIDSPEERSKKYTEFQKILAKDAPAIFLYSPYYDYGINKKVKGFTGKIITLPSDRLNGIEEWYLKTKLGWK